MMTETLRAVVVGAYGGIGLALCDLIARGGGEAFLIGRSPERLHEVADRFGWACGVADASDWEKLEGAIAAAESVLGGFNAVINLAGSVLLKPMHLTSRSEWDNTLMANVTTAAGVVRTCAPKMFAAGGSIVLMSSAAATIGLANHEAIAAAKGAVEGLVRSAASTYAAKNIRINAIAPGLVQTPLTERIWNNPRASDVSMAMHPLGRFGQPADIARAAFWLAQPDQSWISGQVLGVDGGLSRLKSMNAQKQ